MKNVDNIKIRQCKTGEESPVAYMHLKWIENYCTHDWNIFKNYIVVKRDEPIVLPENTQLWVATINSLVNESEIIIGSIAIVRVENNIAQLRWLLTDPGFRNGGIGKKLMDTAMKYCREHGYSHVFLRTLNIFEAARHLYSKYEFIPTEHKLILELEDSILIEERWDFVFSSVMRRLLWIEHL